MKTCIKCDSIKESSDFYKKRNICKACCVKRALAWKANNPDKAKKIKSSFYEKNPSYQAEYLAKNPDKKQRKYLYAKEWLSANPSKTSEYRESSKQRNPTYQQDYYSKNKTAIHSKLKAKYQTDSLFRLKRQIRCLIANAFRRQSLSKSNKTTSLIGCSFEELRQHLISTAVLRYGIYNESTSYHIDHIVPICTAKDTARLIELQHYSNLQLLTPEDNLKKGGNSEINS